MTEPQLGGVADLVPEDGVPIYIRIGNQPEEMRIGWVSRRAGDEYLGKLLRWLADELDPAAH